MTQGKFLVIWLKLIAEGITYRDCHDIKLIERVIHQHCLILKLG